VFYFVFVFGLLSGVSRGVAFSLKSPFNNVQVWHIFITFAADKKEKLREL